MTRPAARPADDGAFFIRHFLRPLALPGALLAVAATLSAAEPPTELSSLIVTAARAPQPADTLPVPVTTFDAAALRASPALALDDTLRSDPAFGLFRRSGSLTANPTAQGVSLRGLGPSGASRSLVLLDGIPLNDPFGGWVAWTKIPKNALASAEIVHGGGSGVWGNSALGGAVQLLTAPPAASRAHAEALVGDFDTRGAELSAAYVAPGARDSVTVDAAAFATDGTGLVRDPGPVDRPADLDYRRVQATWRHALADTLDLALTARAYAEDRGNGTPLQRNSSEEKFLSARLSGSPSPDFAWTAVAYAQDQTFASFFTSVDPARTTEMPANDQYDVPATAFGAAFTATWGAPGGDAATTAGLDLRRVEGETRESYLFVAPGFTRDRRAGGEQTFAGLFARHERLLLPSLRASAAARVDFWQNTGGFLRERDTTTGALLTDTRQPGRDGVEFSPSAGLVWQPAPALRARAAAYRAFRVPTLNEYHRPFRVGPVTTLANPALDPETLSGFETGLDLGRAGAPLSASLTAFVNDLRDAVTNVTVAPSTRRRENLDRIRVRGLEAALRARPHPALYLEFNYLLSDARVADPGPAAPAALDGNRLAQVPRHTLAATAAWRAPAAFVLTARLRHASSQYEDDENTLRLAPATTLDLALSRRFASRWEILLAVENALDAGVQTGRTAAGVVSIAPPRWSRLSLRCDW